MIIVEGGVTTAKGFAAKGVKAGIKKSGRKDLALLYSEVPAVAAGAFTVNRFQASPVKVSKLHLKNKVHQAIIINSGNANCINGHAGDQNAVLMTHYAAIALGLTRNEVLVASTGIIGKDLPIEKIKRVMPQLVEGLSISGGVELAEAIMTTDTVKKESAVKVKMGDSVVTIGGACKGVGMIYPYMKTAKHATMLGFLTTDAAISKRMLESALEEAIADSFNMLSVDGDMSTNDSCFILANGLAGNRRIDSKNNDYKKFTEALKFLTSTLAKMLARDGEGATKFVEVEVVGAKLKDDAVTIARKVTTSNLLKTCIYGQDPNWGRILASSGSAGVDFDPDKVDVYIGNIKVVQNGGRIKGYKKDKAAALFKEKNIDIKIDLKAGKASATAWTCDLSKEYVAINSEYST